MAGKCFFTPGVKADAEFVELTPDAAHHLDKVMRLRPGDAVEVRDGLGNAWSGEISRVGQGGATVRLLEKLDLSNLESPLEITLILAIVRADIMDMTVRQATELGVGKILFFRASRSQYGLDEKQAKKKFLRWSKIAGGAICQCRRTKVPGLGLFESLDHLLGALPPADENTGAGLRIFAMEGERERSLESLRRAGPSCSAVMAAIGPEGGWDGAEIAGLNGAGFHPVHLGPRILRFETAAAALITSVQLLWGDFGSTGAEGER